MVEMRLSAVLLIRKILSGEQNNLVSINLGTSARRESRDITG